MHEATEASTFFPSELQVPLKEFLFTSRHLLYVYFIILLSGSALTSHCQTAGFSICMNEVILERILLSSFDYLSANNSDNTLCTDKPNVNFYSHNYKPEMQNDLGFFAKVAPSRFSCFHTFIFSLLNTHTNLSVYLLPRCCQPLRFHTSSALRFFRFI